MGEGNEKRVSQRMDVEAKDGVSATVTEENLIKERNRPAQESRQAEEAAGGIQHGKNVECGVAVCMDMDTTQIKKVESTKGKFEGEANLKVSGVVETKVNVGEVGKGNMAGTGNAEISTGNTSEEMKIDSGDGAHKNTAGTGNIENAAEVKAETNTKSDAAQTPNSENATEEVKEETHVEVGDIAHRNTSEIGKAEKTNGEIKEETNTVNSDIVYRSTTQKENATKDEGPTKVKEESNLVEFQVEDGEAHVNTKAKEVQYGERQFEETPSKLQTVGCDYPVSAEVSNQSFIWNTHSYEGDGSGTEEEQAAFMKELETFHKEKSLEFKPPKFYGEGLNCLKLWRAVTRLGGYDQVTSCKLWRQVGESFNPPKTCTTVSWSFRCFYEKALLEYEKHKIRTGELQIPLASVTEPITIENQTKSSQAPGSGRTIRDAAARAMQGWHSQRLLGNGEVGDPIIKDKNSISLLKRDKQLKNVGLLKRKKTSPLERSAKVARTKPTDQQTDAMVVDVGPPADWVKINVRRTKDCFEIYALVPGLLREEVHVQSDPAGRLVISGEPEQLDNPWGVTPFKKVVTLPSRIDPHQTSAVVTLHGQLFVRAPFEQPDMLLIGM